MAARRLASYVLAVALFAVAFAVAIGDPPPKQPPDPGVTAVGSVITATGSPAGGPAPLPHPNV